MSQTIFEKSHPGRRAITMPQLSSGEARDPISIPPALCAATPPELPEVSELDVIRHFTWLSQINFCVDTNFYPLGSCTMKYNPRINEQVAALEGFASGHPLIPQLPGGEPLTQGTLKLLWYTEQLLGELTGMDAFTLQPLAGAHGELAGLLLIAAYHRAKGQHRTKVLIPDSAHGTNPASAAIAGFDVVAVATDSEGNVLLDDFRAKLTPETAAVMLTCPNTLGLFEREVHLLAEIAHANDTLLYYDGANMNALMGRVRPGDLGFDVIHLNVHKTLSTPHGGGGPGAGPVGVKSSLIPFLPTPVVVERSDGSYGLNFDKPASIGALAPFYGNFSVLLRAYAYLIHLGGNGLRAATDHAVLNANYLRVKLRDHFKVPFDKICLHEVVLSLERQAKEHGVRALDVAKALIDAGHHPPTVYFPLIVPECLMIEPTETESRQTLDQFVADMLEIAERIERDPASFAAQPSTTPVSRPDETRAAREMKLVHA